MNDIGLKIGLVHLDSRISAGSATCKQLSVPLKSVPHRRTKPSELFEIYASFLGRLAQMGQLYALSFALNEHKSSKLT